MTYDITLIPGDGIGPEITAATLTVLDRANALFKLDLEWHLEEIGFRTLKKEGNDYVLKDGKNTLWLWERGTGASRQLTTDGFENLSRSAFSPGACRRGTTFVWHQSPH